MAAAARPMHVPLAQCGSAVVTDDILEYPVVSDSSPQQGPQARLRRSEWREERSLALHRAVARHVCEDPSIVARAVAQLDRWEELSSRTAGDRAPAHATWRQILTTGTPEEIVDLLVEDSPRARRLRHFSPFAGVLPEAERLAIFARYEGV